MGSVHKIINLSKIEKALVYITTSIILVQSITWVILCLIGISIGFNKGKALLDSGSYMEVLQLELKYIFLFNGDYFIIFPKQIISQILFFIIELIFLVANIGWAICSILVISNLNKNRPGFTKHFRDFGYYSIIICIMDFIVAMMLFSDYSKCLKANPEINSIYGTKFIWEALCANSFLLLGFIAFKGVVLWIINLLIASFAIYTSRYLTLKAIGAIVEGENQPYLSQGTPNQPFQNVQNFEPSFNNNGYSNSAKSLSNVNLGNNYYNPNMPKPHDIYPNRGNGQQFPNSNGFNRNNGNPEDYNNQNMDPSYLRQGFRPDNVQHRQNNTSNQDQINSNYPNRNLSTNQDLKNMQNFAIERPKLMNQRPAFNPRNRSMYN